MRRLDGTSCARMWPGQDLSGDIAQLQKVGGLSGPHLPFSSLWSCQSGQQWASASGVPSATSDDARLHFLPPRRCSSGVSVVNLLIPGLGQTFFTGLFLAISGASHFTLDAFSFWYLFSSFSLLSQLSVPAVYYGISICAVFFFSNSLASWYTGEWECGWLVSSIGHMRKNAQRGWVMCLIYWNRASWLPSQPQPLPRGHTAFANSSHRELQIFLSVCVVTVPKEIYPGTNLRPLEAHSLQTRWNKLTSMTRAKELVECFIFFSKKLLSMWCFSKSLEVGDHLWALLCR